MPRVYLSPSTQEGNYYVTGGTEEQSMNLLCDQVIPYLEASGIAYARNDPNQSAAAAIRQANAGSYGLYVALHSNAAPEGRYGTQRGVDIYYHRYSQNSRRAAELFVHQLQEVYPLPQSVRAVSTETLGEVSRTRAPAVLLELGYHDNVSDADWIQSSRPAVARAIAAGITEFFALPLAMPQTPQTAQVRIRSGTLNIRARPSLRGTVLASAANGSALTVVGTLEDWFVVRYGSLTGYAAREYVKLL